MSTTPSDQQNEPTLADSDERQEDRGRIGYGRNERASSWLLGAALIAIVLGIGAWQWWFQDDAEENIAPGVDSPAVGTAAPDFTLRTFAGEDVTLSEHRGEVVILNFWGSWCEPCKREMPAFEAYWQSAPDDVLLIGIGSKQDTDERAREFAEGFDITYPIGRDTGGDRVTMGTIAANYTITFYPMTFIINPDGVISSLVVGEMDEHDLDAYVQKARAEAAIVSTDQLVIHRREIAGS